VAQDIAVLDFGSGKIDVLIGERGVNNTICINGMGECDYAGFADGEWFEPDQLGYAIGHAINNAETNSRTKIKRLYVGVPGEFTTVVCRDVSISLTKKRKVTEADVDMLHEQGDVFRNNPDYTVINIGPVYYTLDDDRRLVQPVGMTSNKLGGHISYVLAENRFIHFVGKILEELGIESIEFVSSVLAEELLLFDDITRDQYVVLIDVGYITTSVAVGRGDGLLGLYNFSLGGGHITGDLAMAFGISFSQAESLKRKVVLSLNASDADVYEITDRDSRIPFPAKTVNEIVMERIKLIASTIEKCLSKCEYDYPDYIPYHLTGGGLSYLKGARDYLSKRLNKPVEIVSPSFPPFSRPHMSSGIGLMDMLLDQQPQEKKGFFARLFGKK
jgi:cell division protein FtsA